MKIHLFCCDFGSVVKIWYEILLRLDAHFSINVSCVGVNGALGYDQCFCDVGAGVSASEVGGDFFFARRKGEGLGQFLASAGVVAFLVGRFRVAIVARRVVFQERANRLDDEDTRSTQRQWFEA